jgi:protein-tyrosine phosphatase
LRRSILFVCLGNICRSPLAEAVAKRIIEERGLGIRIDSCGTGSWHIGEPPCDDAIRVAKEHALDISGLRARRITEKDLDTFEQIIALDESNRRDLVAMGAKNVRKLGFYGFNDDDVPDPYFFPGYEGFDRVYSMIESCVVALIEEAS